MCLANQACSSLHEVEDPPAAPRVEKPYNHAVLARLEAGLQYVEYKILAFPLPEQYPSVNSSTPDCILPSRNPIWLL